MFRLNRGLDSFTQRIIKQLRGFFRENLLWFILKCGGKSLTHHQLIGNWIDYHLRLSEIVFLLKKSGNESLSLRNNHLAIWVDLRELRN